MSTQTFETLIEFTSAGGSASGTAATSDPMVIAVLLIALALAASAAILALSARKGGTLASDGSSAVPSAVSRIAPIAAIALAALLAVGMLLPSGSAIAAAGRDVNASVPAKVTATVGADGSVSIASGTIANSDDVLAIGVRKVATASTADLGDATLKLSIGGTVVYSGALGNEVVIDDYATVAKGASADMSFEVSVPAERASALAGTSPITVKTTVDSVSAPSGKAVAEGGNPVAGAKVAATYTDPYTGLARTYETTTDETGSYTLAPMMYGTSGTVSFSTEAGLTAEASFTADEGQSVPDTVLLAYLKFTANTAGSTVTPRFEKGSWEYSTDGGTNWTAGSNNGTKITLTEAGDSVLLRGNECKTNNSGRSFSMTGSIAASGSVTSLTDNNGANPNVTLTDSCYYAMFKDCTALTAAPVLPATTLANKCYSWMFYGCSALKEAPALPVTTLTEGCYTAMFSGCTSLASAPALPATTLTDSCYNSMFSGCKSLTQAPALPATALAKSCYGGMFSGCTSLASAPALPATALAESCYSAMFKDCTALTAVSALPAETLAKGCYSTMFSGCTSLASAPALPATALTESCYYAMFSGCTALTAVSALPASVVVAPYCCQNMFYGCTSLASVPEKLLPAETLAQGCYHYMFYGCTSLANAPELPATTLATYCYFYMFQGCTSLTAAPELPATSLAMNCYQCMFSGCTALKVAQSDSTSVDNKIFTRPSSASDSTVKNMFKGTSGSFTGTPTANNTYYWYTES